ncbi:MAG: GyrI-like domain-containing protein [Chloroflexota bacterium]
MSNKKMIISAIILTIVAVGQIILAFLLYNPEGNVLLINCGWGVLMLSAIFGWLPIFTFRKKGDVKGRGDMHNKIGECFRRVQAWVREHGYDPLTQLTIGVIKMVDGKLSSYGCCIEVPTQVQSGLNDIDIKELPGGRYAVVSIPKDPDIIGKSIGYFYQEYVPQNQIMIDDIRSTYEIYYENTMEYCVPIL